MNKKFLILGGTGSIGTQTLDIIKKNNDVLIGFSFYQNIHQAKQIIEEFHPKYVCCKDLEQIANLKKLYPLIKFYCGNEGLCEIIKVQDKDTYIINALVGSVGLRPSYEALSSGFDLYLANKESLVIGGEILKKVAKQNHVEIIPIDSEHSAIYQLLKGQQHQEINKLYITASGGAFRNLSHDELIDVTLSDALKHPNWQMGNKITIDCATMMNKVFELIEAHYLFDIDMNKIIPVLHQESIVHSLVEFKDGSIFGQLSNPDMHLPIEYAIYQNHQEHYPLQALDLFNLNLSFKKLSEERYPLISLAKEVMDKGKFYPTVLNAVNEMAVELFINNKISFLDIEKLIIEEINNPEYLEYQNQDLTIDNILLLDQKIRNKYIK